MGHRASATAEPAIVTPAAERNWVAHAAALWAFVFAAMSFYWAAGGSIGIGTQAESIRTLARERDAWFVATLWLTGALKVVAALLALALAQGWGGVIPRRLLVAAAWLAGAGMALYGGLNAAAALIVAGLWGAGVTGTPEDVPGFWWHLLLWDPFWLTGGLLFCAAAWSYQRMTRSGPTPVRDAAGSH